jgi:DNA-binding MarR family transcriptional regulator
LIGGQKPPQELAHNTGFLMNWIGVRSRERFHQAMAELELHPRDFGILTIIAERPGATQQEISADTDIDVSTMVAAIDSLEERGLAERRVHPADRRKRSVHVTRRGQKVLERAGAAAQRINDEVFGVLTEAERRRFDATLRKLAGLDA